MRNRKEQHALLDLWLIPALRSVNCIVARWAPGVISPYTLAFGRWAVAGVLLVAVARRELWQERAYIAAEWQQYLVLGFAACWCAGPGCTWARRRLWP